MPSQTMSDTPRTDANCFEPAAEGSMSRARSDYSGAFVPAKLARELERENKELREVNEIGAQRLSFLLHDIALLRVEIERLKEALNIKTKTQ